MERFDQAQWVPEREVYRIVRPDGSAIEADNLNALGEILDDLEAYQQMRQRAELSYRRLWRPGGKYV